MVTDKRFHSWRPLLSHDAIIYMAEGARGVGKSYPMLIRAMRRMMRHHRSIVWLRRTDVEVKDWLASFGSEKWCNMARQARLDPDKLRRQGATILYNRGDDKRPQWEKLLRAGAVSSWSHFRDTDDPREEMIYLDEAFATVEAHRRYQGNEVDHCLDILKSLRRGEGSDLRLLIAGNAERAANPWVDYFGLKRPAIHEGIVRLQPTTRGSFGSIMYERIPRYHIDDLDALLTGTAMGDFLAGKPKGLSEGLLAPIPRKAACYARTDFGRLLSLWIEDGVVYVSTRKGYGPILRDRPDGRPETVVITPDVRRKFFALRAAWRRGNVRFDSPEAHDWGMLALGKLL